MFEGPPKLEIKKPHKKTYYEILGISPDANSEEIRRTFHELSKKFHPDIGGNLEQQQKISQAYNTLKNSESKNTYDLELKKKENPNLFSQGNVDLDKLKEKLDRERKRWEGRRKAA